MIKDLHEVAPWLRNFEHSWGSDWILSKIINLQMAEINRKKERDELAPEASCIKGSTSGKL
jgi:hypothetical protein